MSKPNQTASVKADQRYKFSKLHVLLVDGDMRSAQLVRQILETFGLKKVTSARSAKEAMATLTSSRVDLLIVEWRLGDGDGLGLVRTLRTAKDDRFMQFDTPVIMLTGLAKEQHVRAARDAGVTEFLAKPFTAKTLCTRLVEIIDKPREFVETDGYRGPTRRRRMGPPPGVEDRRIPREQQLRRKDVPKVTITKPNYSLRDMLDGMSASDILTTEVIEEAQQQVMKAEGEFVEWVKADIEKLEEAYARLLASPDDKKARVAMLDASYTIKSQSGMFGYDIGTVVSDMLVSYLTQHGSLTENNFVVLRKHIDTMGVIFTQQIKELDGAIGTALIGSLAKLVEKFG